MLELDQIDTKLQNPHKLWFSLRYHIIIQCLGRLRVALEVQHKTVLSYAAAVEQYRWFVNVDLLFVVALSIIRWSFIKIVKTPVKQEQSSR